MHSHHVYSCDKLASSRRREQIVAVDEVRGPPTAGGRARLPGTQRRQEIILAAQTVFAANGLAGARTSTIADAAGIAESMLYRHFASKQELFEVAVVQPVAEFVEGVVDGADRLLDRDGPGSQVFYESFLQTMTEVLPLLGVALFSDAQDGRRFYNDKIVPLFDRYEENVRASLTGITATSVSAAFLSRAVIGIVFLLTLDATYRETPADLGPANSAGTAEAVRSFVASALSGSSSDVLLHHLSDIESRPDRPAGATALPPTPPFVADDTWARYWSVRASAAAETDERLRELDAENQILRRILADQSIELHRLRVGQGSKSANSHG
jgi:TetR/AcrR family transcriptional regulator